MKSKNKITILFLSTLYICANNPLFTQQYFSGEHTYVYTEHDTIRTFYAQEKKHLWIIGENKKGANQEWEGNVLALYLLGTRRELHPVWMNKRKEILYPCFGHEALGKTHTSAIGLPFFHAICEYLFRFDNRRKNNLVKKPYLIQTADMWGKCMGFYYLDKKKHYKVYRFAFYQKTKWGHYRTLTIHFCPQIGYIKAKAKNQLNTYTVRPRKVILSLKLNSIDGLPLQQFIQKDTCITPFCEIDK